MINIGLIGAGRIGFSYDCQRPDLTMTHLKAILENPEFNLQWVCEPDVDRVQQLVEFGIDSAIIMSNAPPAQTDIVVIATPTSIHEKTILEALKCSPKVILCEKPLGSDLASAKRIYEAVCGVNVTLLVDYMRRCEPGVLQLRDSVQTGLLGEFYKGVCWYSGGIKNCASHFVDLMRFLFGNIQNILPISTRDKTLEDPDLDFILVFESGLTIYFIAGNESAFGSKELELLSEKGMLRYLRGGFDIEFHPAVEHEHFSGYRAYGLMGQPIVNDYMNFMRYVYQNLAAHFNEGASALPTLDDAIAVHEVIEQVLNTA